MGSMQHIRLPVEAPLDTSMPDTNRPPGTLVEATDVSTFVWGPRYGMTQQTWPIYGVTPIPFGGATYAFDGTNDFADFRMRAPEQYNLGTRWTLDIVFRPESVTHSSDSTVPIFEWSLAAVSAIKVMLVAGGGSGANQRKVKVIVTPTSSPGVAGTAVTLDGTTQVSAGTTLADVHHIRVTRDGATLTLYVDGVQEAQSTSISATQRHEATVGATTLAHAYIGMSNGLAAAGNHYFKGRVHAILLRSALATDVTKGARDFEFGKLAGTHFHFTGTTVSFPDDLSSFQNAIFSYSATSTSSEIASRPWYLNRVQGGAHFRDSTGRVWNAVMIGGYIGFRRVA